MKAEVNRYIDSCEVCQRSKRTKQHIPLKPLPLAEGPWKDTAYDFIVKLPRSKVGMEEYDSILTVMNRFSGMAHFVQTKEATNAEELAKSFIDKVWKHHGLLAETVSDHGTTFNSQFLCSLHFQLGLEPSFSTAYHPETDRKAKHANHWVEGYL